MAATPLSAPLSHLLIAFTIEVDNELERRLAEVETGRYVRVSLVMWSNFLRFVGSGVAVDALTEDARLPKARVLSTLGALERWRHVTLGPAAEPPPVEKRDGWGSARGIRGDWVVRPTEVGLHGQELWPVVLEEVHGRWQERFGPRELEELRGALLGIVGRLEGELPQYLPILTGTSGMKAEAVPRARRDPPPSRPDVLLAQALLAYTLDFESRSELSLALAENVVRVLAANDVDVRALPAAAAISREAASMALTALVRDGLVAVEQDAADPRAKIARLTDAGRRAGARAHEVHATVERQWEARFGRDDVRRLRGALRAVLDQRDGERSRLARGLEPHRDGWRASGRYLPRTRAMLEDPRTGLPRYPMVLHRGGWPDGS